MRTILILLLSVMSAAGPWLCCCSLPRLAAAWTPAPQPVEVFRCCCHQETPADDSSAPVPHLPCSCQDERPDAAVAAPDLDMATLNALTWDPLATVPCHGGIGDLLAVQDGLTPNLCSAFPYLEPADMLRAHHVLIC